MRTRATHRTTTHAGRNHASPSAKTPCCKARQAWAHQDRGGPERSAISPAESHTKPLQRARAKHIALLYTRSGSKPAQLVKYHAEVTPGPCTPRPRWPETFIHTCSAFTCINLFEIFPYPRPSIGKIIFINCTNKSICDHLI